ncbi:alpha-(1,3)-fucosyltransferase C-like [Haliotis rubra]|uniref:alpha-(1,3)-fucosyltransferase C-like n=1 Tax=Haliotis rubra TaxID=36100 RepID=UPI001EE61E10|nr:alpha-(1,3)-fucosyltransferase C-like [Haliotis rubra]XP_046551402.1 alpha-(1,3)-fucosyltransferase C-like [Haliotis rubra]
MKRLLRHSRLTLNTRLRICFFCLILFAGGLFLEIFNVSEVSDNEYIHIFDAGKAPNSSHKTILLWTSLFDNSTWTLPNLNIRSCPNYYPSKCDLTTDRTRLVSSDALLFHIGDVYKLPSIRRSDHIWVIFNMEALPNIRQSFKHFNGLFNWTSWYRTDSTVPMSYGYALKRSIRDTEAPLDIFAEKSKMVFWAASNCDDRVQRYKMVNELKQYVDVDTYGRCGELVCDKTDKKCFEKLAEYKFVLSFENSHCRDYVTEKYWLALRRRQIPVVYGGADYESLVLPNSYINVRDFANLSSLATYMLDVAENRTLYNSYFDWMRDYELPPCNQELNEHCFDMESYFCSLCGALHERTVPSQVYSNLHRWATDDLPQCEEFSYFRWIISWILPFM